MAETLAAPLEKAAAEAREALRRNTQGNSEFGADGCKCMGCALARLLAALDADKRLERAEAVLRAVRECEALTLEDTIRRIRNIAKSYFAEKGERP